MVSLEVVRLQFKTFDNQPFEYAKITLTCMSNHVIVVSNWKKICDKFD